MKKCGNVFQPHDTHGVPVVYGGIEVTLGGIRPGGSYLTVGGSCPRWQLS